MVCRLVSSAALRRAFTLVEVLVAMGVMSLISAGLLATVWRMTGFAREEAERMMADGLCHDIMWAVYSQKYEDIKSIATTSLTSSFLPRLSVKNTVTGKSTTTYPLRRGSTSPRFKVTVKEVAEKVDGTDVISSNKLITVTVIWYDANNKTVKPYQTLQVVRSSVERQSESTKQQKEGTK